MSPFSVSAGTVIDIDVEPVVADSAIVEFTIVIPAAAVALRRLFASIMRHPL